MRRPDCKSVTNLVLGVQEDHNFQIWFLVSYLQVVGKCYLRIDPVGGGAKWRRSYGQEIYSPFLLAFAEQVK